MFSKKQMQEVFEKRDLFEDPLYAVFEHAFWKFVEDCSKTPGTIKQIGDGEYRISVNVDIPKNFMKFFAANVTVPNELIKGSDWKYLHFRLDPAVRIFGQGITVNHTFKDSHAEVASHDFDHFLISVNLS